MALFGVIIILFLSLSFFRNLSRLRDIESAIEISEVDMELMVQEKQGIGERSAYIQGSEYLELNARDRLGMAMEGEIVIVLPGEDVLRAMSPRRVVEIKEELTKANWRKWVELFI